MREGPLAALFRRTDEEGEETPKPESAAPAAPPSEPAAAEPSAPEAEVEAPSIPSPQERLRHAFSSDIPENVLAPATPAGRGREAPAERVHPVAAPAPEPGGSPVLRVVGVGGAGVNAVNRMVEAEVEGVEFIAINTDQQSLQGSAADITVHIGAGVTRGLGSGADPDLGRQSAMEDYDKVKALLKGSDMVFITAGSGGGTGTGAAPVVARIAKEIGALTVGIVT